MTDMEPVSEILRLFFVFTKKWIMDRIQKLSFWIVSIIHFLYTSYTEVKVWCKI